MKKSLLMIAAILGSMALSAQTFTASCTITMKGVPSGTPDELYIYEIKEAHADKFDNGMDATKMINNRLSTSVNVYAQTSYGKLSTVALPDIKGLPLPIITNESETNYVFSFSDVDGDIKLDDMELDSIHPMSKGDYAFVAENGKKTIANRFRIYKPFTPDAGELAVCVYFDNIEITNNPYTDNIVVKDMEGNVVLTKAPRATPQVISLENLASGHYFLEIGTESFEFYNKPEAK